MFYDEAVTIDTKGLLRFEDNVVHREPKLFYLNAAREYYLDASMEENPLLYAFYERNYWEKDEALFKKYELNYNLKLIRPGMIGHEYLKTIPHFHIEDELTEETYPEIHEVLEGEGVFLLQKHRVIDQAQEVIAVPFVKGDHIFIKNGFGHSTINTGDQPILIASLIKKNSEKDYQPFAENKGSLYYLTKDDEGQQEYILNPSYERAIGLEIQTSPYANNPLQFKGSLYETFVENPEFFSVLWK